MINFMQQAIEGLKNSIIESLKENNDWKLIELTYNEKNCNPSGNCEDDPGIQCILMIGEESFNLWYPLNRYITLEEMIENINTEAAVLNMVNKYNLPIQRIDAKTNTVEVIHPITSKIVKLNILDKCFNKETGEFNVDSFYIHANALLTNAKRNAGGFYSGIIFSKPSDIPSTIPAPFSIKAEDCSMGKNAFNN